MQIMATLRASWVLMRREGNGRLRVRSIFSSNGHSWYWLKVEAPDASRNIPATGRSIGKATSPVQMTIAAKAVKVTARETGKRVKIRRSLKLEVCKKIKN